MKLNDSTLNLTGSEIVLRKTAVEQNASFRKITECYNEFAKLVFLFDISGSMEARVAHDKSGKSYTDQFVWPADVLTDLRSKIIAAITATMVAESQGGMALDVLSDLEMMYFSLKDENRDASGCWVFTADDEELKVRIIKMDLMLDFGIVPDFGKKHQQPLRKIEIVQKLAKQEIGLRFKKYPQSRICVIPFDSGAKVLFDDGKPEAVDAEIDKLPSMCGGGTDIMNAIGVGMETCAKNPSAVNIHHFILVTDGSDHGTTVIGEWIPNMKASGIVLDYIHIGEEAEANASLQAACKQLGGDYVVVNTEKELEEKFVEVVRRPMLPPASTVK